MTRLHIQCLICTRKPVNSTFAARLIYECILICIKCILICCISVLMKSKMISSFSNMLLRQVNTISKCFCSTKRIGAVTQNQ